MELHKDVIEGLRSTNHQVGVLNMQVSQDGLSVHRLITVDGVAMRIELAVELNSGRVTLAQITAHLGKTSN